MLLQRGGKTWRRGDRDLQPLRARIRRQPYDQYASIRAQGRRSAPCSDAAAPHYDDCFGPFRRGTSVDDRNANNVFRYQPPEDIAERMAGRDERRPSWARPLDHTRLRRLVSSAFTVRRIEQLRERVRELVAGLLDDVAAAGAAADPVDLIARYALPLPFMVISELLGMPEGNRDELRGWSHTMTLSLEPYLDDDTPARHRRRRRQHGPPRRRRHRVEAPPSR